MPLPTEVQTYVDTLTFKDANAKAAYTALLEDPATAEAAFLMQSDYTKKTQETAAERKALEAAREALGAEQEDLLQRNNVWKSDIEKRLEASLKQASDANLYGAALKNKLSMLAAQYGEDPDELLKDVMTMRKEEVKVEPAAPAFDPESLKKDFVSRKEYEEAVSAVALFGLEFEDVRRDFRKLNGGTDMDGSLKEMALEGYKEVAARRQKGEQINFRQYMEQKLDFNGLKEANSKAEREAWEKQTKEEIEKNVRSEYLASNPGATRPMDQPDEWRTKLNAKSRADREPARNSMRDTQTRQQDLHRHYEELASKRKEGAAA